MLIQYLGAAFSHDGEACMILSEGP